MLVPVIRLPPLGPGEPLGGDDVGAGRSDVGFLAAVSRRALAAADVDSRVGPSRFATATIRAPQASELIVEWSTYDRSEKNEGNHQALLIADPADAPRIVALDPAVVPAVANLLAVQPHQPLPGRDPDERLARGMGSGRWR